METGFGLQRTDHHFLPSSLFIVPFVLKRKKGKDIFVPLFEGVGISQGMFFLSVWALSFSEVHRHDNLYLFDIQLLF